MKEERTGLYSNTDDFGLMYYNARWYDPYLNRFTQPDTIIPSPSNPQDWDRYSYARNNPVRYNDPSGHFVTDGGCESDPSCKKMLPTFTKAAIKMESPPWGWNYKPRIPVLLWAHWFGGGDYRNRSLGPGKITDGQMEGPEGVWLESLGYGDRGTGLGLRDGPCAIQGCAMDQNNSEIAFIAMRKKITLRLDVCVEYGCTNTDMFMSALLAADERVSRIELRNAFRNYPSTNEAVTVDWKDFLEYNWTSSKDRITNSKLIGLFSKYVMKMQPQGFPEINWDYISTLH